MKNHTGKSKDALLFPAAADSNAHMAPSTLYKVYYYPAREAAGRARDTSTPPPTATPRSPSDFRRW